MPKSKSIEPYEHKGKQRLNNPPVGLVTPETDQEANKKTYAYDPHLDPQLQWAGKAEHLSFDVPTVSLHVHERIDPCTIIEATRKRKAEDILYQQLSLFHTIAENPPIREAIEFYKHKHGWSNRLIAGDSLLVMNSLLEKEGLAGQVQMIYIDPPYGIKYGSNFQPFVNKRDVTNGKDEDLTAEPEQIRAFRDTWELGIHSYLTYLYDRLILARDLLAKTGCIFVQINAENQHLVVDILSELFGPENYIANIIFRKKSIPLGAKHLETMHDHLLLFSKDKNQLKYHHLYEESDVSSISSHGPYALFPDGTFEKIDVTDFKSKLHPTETQYYRLFTLIAPSYSKETDFPYEFEGEIFPPPSGGCWVVSKGKLDILKQRNRLQVEGNSLSYRLFITDFPYKKITALWNNIGTSYQKIYAVQTAPTVVERCMLMMTDPGDLVFDPTCGSGTTAFMSEQWGRRWITCDTSRVAISLAKQRLMTSLFDYYELAHSEDGVDSGFKYKMVPHITMKSIVNNEPPAQETLYDQPKLDNSRARVSGPFTVEAVPAPIVRPVGDIEAEPTSDASVARSGETLRQAQWREELLQTGIRGKGGQRIQFTRVEPLSGTRWLQADAETREEMPQRAVVSFGSAFAPLEQRQVELALDEAQLLIPRPKLVVFAAFQFDPEASKDIDETNWSGVTLLKAQMNTDLLTEDLKKKRSSNESFWLIGQPDVRLRKIDEGEQIGKYQVEVFGFDYYNPKTGAIESGGTNKIAMWMLDTDYDRRSLFPRQVFFPMAGEKEGWARLSKNLKAEIDEELIEAYQGTISLPFEIGDNGCVAVKIVDDRGIESLKVIEVDE
jgi:adenine-specific DNA-methyltransferase